MLVLGVDPGTTESAWCILDTDKKRPVAFAKEANERVQRSLIKGKHKYDHLVIEMVACYGMAVGASTFTTVLWVGRFIEQLACGDAEKYTLIYRKKDVCMELCNNSKAKDSNIRRALLDIYGEQGTKKKPGPLYGISQDIWSALAVAHTYSKKYMEIISFPSALK